MFVQHTSNINTSLPWHFPCTGEDSEKLFKPSQSSCYRKTTHYHGFDNNLFFPAAQLCVMVWHLFLIFFIKAAECWSWETQKGSREDVQCNFFYLLALLGLQVFTIQFVLVKVEQKSSYTNRHLPQYFVSSFWSCQEQENHWQRLNADVMNKTRQGKTPCIQSSLLKKAIYTDNVSLAPQARKIMPDTILVHMASASYLGFPLH